MMNKEEVLEKFAGVELSFSYYHKYRFHYIGELDNYSITGFVGGSHDEIYSSHISYDDTVIMDHLFDELDYVHITLDNKEIFSWEYE